MKHPVTEMFAGLIIQAAWMAATFWIIVSIQDQVPTHMIRDLEGVLYFCGFIMYLIGSVLIGYVFFERIRRTFVVI